MKILVCGAGVLGCNLAADLSRAGKEVTLLARGEWVKTLRERGLRIKNMFSPRTSTRRIPIVTELFPNDRYDVIFVAVRRTQLESVEKALAENRSENIVFVGNNVCAEETAARFPNKNVLFAFAFSAGHRESDRVVLINLKKITIGPLSGKSATEEMSAMNRDIKRFFDENGAEYPTWKELEKEAGEYLKDKNGFERQNKRGQSVRTAPDFRLGYERSTEALFQSRILPSVEIVTTCHGINFSLRRKAVLAACSSPPQQGTSMRTTVTL